MKTETKIFINVEEVEEIVREYLENKLNIQKKYIEANLCVDGVSVEIIFEEFFDIK